MLISHFQALPLLQARKDGAVEAPVSLDLGLTTSLARFFPGELILISEEEEDSLSWKVLAEIAENENNCFLIQGGQIEAVRAFSDLTGRAFSLYPTSSAPTMLISGIPMHRIKDTDPWQDTLAKLRALGAVGGQVLDTATGLGYTAIQAARAGAQVVTIELDPAAREMCRINPWSRELFTRANIELRLGDSFDEVEQMPDASFSCILHDPPAFALAGDLYSAEFYRHCWRILKLRGRIFHYIGDPQSKSGAQVTRGVTRRLLDAGFTRVEPRPQAFGVLAQK